MITRPTLAELFAERDAEWLAQAGEAIEAHERGGSTSPLAIRVLVGFGAWLASLFLVGFAAMVGLADEGVGWFTGLAAVGGAIALRRSAGPGSIFRSQFALSLGAAGQVLLVVHAFDLFDFRGGLLFAAALALAMLALFPDPVQRFASTITAVLCVTGALASDGESIVAVDFMAIAVAAGLWFAFEREARWQRSWAADWHLPVSFGLAVSLAILLAPSVIGEATETVLLVTAAMAIGLIALGLRVAREAEPAVGASAMIGGVVAVLALAALTGSAPGILGGLLAMAIGLRRGHPVLFVGAAAFFVGFVVAFYYHLDVSLLAKSAALLGAGVVLLVTRLALVRGGR